jgi:hypothetical protein
MPVNIPEAKQHHELIEQLGPDQVAAECGFTVEQVLGHKD